MQSICRQEQFCGMTITCLVYPITQSTKVTHYKVHYVTSTYIEGSPLVPPKKLDFDTIHLIKGSKTPLNQLIRLVYYLVFMDHYTGLGSCH